MTLLFHSSALSISGYFTSLSATFLLSILLAFFIFLLVYQYIKPGEVDTDLPGPPRTRFLGVTFGTTNDSFEGERFEWNNWPPLCLFLSRKYNYRTWGGPTLNIGFGPAFFVLVTEDAIRHILRDNSSNYVKSDVTRTCLKELFGDGIFNSDGESWKRHRKIVNSIFTKDFVRYGAKVATEKVDNVARVLDSLVGKYEIENSNEEKKESLPSSMKTIDIQGLFLRMTVEVFVNIAFGVDLQCITNPEKYQSFTDAFDEIQLLCHARFADLFYNIKQRFNLTKREKRIKQCAKIIDEFAYGIIDSKMEKQQHCSPVENGEGSKNNDASNGRESLGSFDLLSSYLRAPKQDNALTRKELRDVFMTFVLAGRDTTAHALTWTIYELTKHPEITDKIIKEIKSKCGMLGHPDSDFSYETVVNNLPYLHAVVMESLRLHPTAPDNFRMAVNDDILPDGTKMLAKSCIMYSPYTINHSEKLWGNDADDFNPDRFVNRPEPSPFKFPTFNAGNRLCLGKPLALMEIKVALARMLPVYEFIDAKCHTGECQWTLTMAMKDGFHVAIKKRDVDIGSSGEGGD